MFFNPGPSRGLKNQKIKGPRQVNDFFNKKI